MAALGLKRHAHRQTPGGVIAFWVAALLAAALSLAAGGVAVFGTATPAVPLASLADEVQARQERIAFFEQRAARDSLDFISLNILAFEYLQRARESGDVSDYQRAEFAATKSLEILPRENYNGVNALAAVKLAQHDFDLAAELARRGIDLKPGDSSAYGLLGDAELGLGNYEEARVSYEKMLELEPALPALSRQADFAWLNGDLINARDFWRQALEYDDGLPIENQAWAHTQLGRLHFSTGDLAAAESDYRNALRLFPGYVHALAGLGSVEAARGDWKAAIEHYAGAQERLPLPEYVAILGDLYTRSGRTAEAEDQYALIEAIDRLYRANGIDNDRQLALFYADHDRNLDEALAMATRAYEAARGIYAADTLAWALFKNGEFRRAAELSSEALRLGTPDPLLHYHAGAIDAALGKLDAARAHLQRALELNPEFSVQHAANARQLLAELSAGEEE